MIEIFGTVSLIIFLILVYYLYREIQKQRQQSTLRNGTHKTEMLFSLKSKAYRMSPGDPSAVDRLAEHIRSKFPGRSDKWIWEKVIADIERDRR